MQLQNLSTSLWRGEDFQSVWEVYFFLLGMRWVFKSLLTELLTTARHLFIEVIYELFLLGDPLSTRIEIFLDSLPLELCLFIRLPKL